MILQIFLIGIQCFASDCGIAPQGSSFGPNCELVREAALPPKKQVIVKPLVDKKIWEPIQLGAYSGKPGYFVNVGNEFQAHLEAVIMNEQVLIKVQQEFSTNTKLGAVKNCLAVGLQQSVGYSLFDLQNCR